MGRKPLTKGNRCAIFHRHSRGYETMNMSRVATLCCVIALAVTMALRAESRQAASTPKGSTQTLNGLEISVRSLDRAPSASLNDCPPGTNREKGLTKQGEEFAVVTVSFKVTPSSKTSP